MPFHYSDSRVMDVGWYHTIQARRGGVTDRSPSRSGSPSGAQRPTQLVGSRLNDRESETVTTTERISFGQNVRMIYRTREPLLVQSVGPDSPARDGSPPIRSSAPRGNPDAGADVDREPGRPATEQAPTTAGRPHLEDGVDGSSPLSLQGGPERVFRGLVRFSARLSVPTPGTGVASTVHRSYTVSATPRPWYRGPDASDLRPPQKPGRRPLDEPVLRRSPHGSRSKPFNYYDRIAAQSVPGRSRTARVADARPAFTRPDERGPADRWWARGGVTSIEAEWPLPWENTPLRRAT